MSWRYIINMYWWKVLEISYDSDLKTIKKAYARLLKIYNPEDDAEGYQRLRQAYDEAVKYTKRNKGSKSEQELSSITLDIGDENTNNITDIINENDTISTKLNLSNGEKIHDFENESDLNISNFINRLDEVYNDMSMRIDYKAWSELLNSEIVWNTFSFPIIEDMLIKFLIKHKNLPSNIWTLLNDNFSWIENERRLYSKYPMDKIENLINNIKNPNQLKYDCLKSISADIEEEYLFFRQKAYEALQEKDYYEAEKNLNSAYDLFKEDGELLRLLGDYNYDFDNIDKALEFYNLAFEKNSNDIESALHIGIILCLNEDFIAALPYLKLYLSINNNNKSALYSIAYCYYYNNDLTAAKSSLQSFLNIIQKDKIAKKYLKNIGDQLKGKYNKKINFNNYKSEIKERITKEFKLQEGKSLNIKQLVKVVILILLIISGVISAFNDRDENLNNKTTGNAIEQTSQKSTEDLKDDETFKAINSKEDLKKIQYFINIKMHLKDIEPLEYYKLKQVVNNKIIVSKEELNSSNLQDKVESQLYMGTFDGNVMIFADSNYSEGKLESDKSYIAKGALTTLGYKSIIDIKAKYNSTKDFYWPKDGTYIDCSQSEIERVKKDNNLMEVHNGKRIRVSKTAEDFLGNDYPGLQSLYLKDIKPIDLYVSLDENDEFDFLWKNELNDNDLADYSQAYVGKLDGKNIMFIDKNFSIKSLDISNGSTIYGYVYKFQLDESITVPIGQGNDAQDVSIEANFIYNKDN